MDAPFPPQSPVSGRRIGLYFSRLSPPAAVDQSGRHAGRRGLWLYRDVVALGRRSPYSSRTYPSCGGPRQRLDHLSQHNVRGLQSQSAAPTRRPRTAVSADPRCDPRIQPGVYRRGGAGGGRSDRVIHPRGIGAGVGRNDCVVGQGPDAADRRRSRWHAGRHARHHEEPADFYPGSVRKIWCETRKSWRCAGADGRRGRQYTRDSRRRPQNRDQVDPGKWRPPDRFWRARRR